MFVIPTNSKIEKKKCLAGRLRWLSRSTSDSRNRAVLQKRLDNVFSSQLKKKMKTILKLLWLLLMNILCLQAFNLAPNMGRPGLTTRSSIAVARQENSRVI